MEPATSHERSGGRRTAWPDSTRTYSACALRVKVNATTSSPAAQGPASSPVSSMTPARSYPCPEGKAAGKASCRAPSRMNASPGLMPVALTLSRNCPGAGTGRSTSTTCSTSTPPYLLYLTARGMARPSAGRAAEGRSSRRCPGLPPRCGQAPAGGPPPIWPGLRVSRGPGGGALTDRFGQHGGDLEQLLLLFGRQVPEDLADVGLVLLPAQLELVCSRRGQGHDRAPAVLRVGPPLDELVGAQCLDQVGHAALGHAQRPGQVGHGLVAAALERVQQAHPDVADRSGRGAGAGPVTPGRAEFSERGHERIEPCLGALPDHDNYCTSPLVDRRLTRQARGYPGWPPSTLTFSPVIHCARSETRKATASAMSRGSPARPMGKLAPSAAAVVPIAFATSSRMAVPPGVSTEPGVTVLTRIFGARPAARPAL